MDERDKYGNFAKYPNTTSIIGKRQATSSAMVSIPNLDGDTIDDIATWANSLILVVNTLVMMSASFTSEE